LSAIGGGGAVAHVARAKINLYLHVVGRRADGYHLLDSLIAFADIGDVVACRPSLELSLSIEGPFAGDLSAGEDNLVMRAARRLQAARGGVSGAAIVLDKVLPVASGIGGGSADAAAALRALGELWRQTPDESELARIGFGLGADVPVCLFGRPAFVGGIGEAIEPAPALPPAWLVLVNPGSPLSTADVFGARTEPFTAPARWQGAPVDVSDLARLLASRDNDLAAPARRLAPAIDEVLAALSGADACLLARLSGSGATCFGLFAAEVPARSAAKRIGGARPDWWVMPCALSR
jgi:4-diphosphocytidyl-2-C-methyl-D-erythritol kinase